MADLKAVCDELNVVSDKISTQIRTLSLAIMAAIWAILTRKDGVSAASQTGLLIAGFLAFLSLVADFLQYFAGALNAETMRRRMIREGLKEIRFGDNHFLFNLREWVFWIKQGLLGVSVLFFLGSVAKVLLQL